MEFSQLALEKLIQLFPELANYVVTFKDVTEDTNRGDNSDVSVGIFVLQLGGQYFYVPIIAKGEAIQPIDSVFDIQKESFTPLTKSFVQQAINTSQLSMGKAKKIPKTINRNPSVYDMVTPPRTGKFVYASSSRLTEFLSLLPNMTKQAMFEKFSEDKELYSSLHRLFGLENILSSLRPTVAPVPESQPQGIQVLTGGTNLDSSTVKSILDKGYAIKGEQPTNRIAIMANDASLIGKFRQLASIDAGRDFDIILNSGESKSAYIPKRSVLAPQFAALLSPFKGGDPVLAIFSNGDYSISGDMVAVGEGFPGHSVLTDLFSNQSPSTPKDLGFGDTFALLTADLEFLGVYNVNSIEVSDTSVNIKARDLIRNVEPTAVYGHAAGRSYFTSIQAFVNCKKATSQGNDLFVPYNCLVVKLNKNISDRLEPNITSALAKAELNTLMNLGASSDIGYDGVEFSYNGSPVGPEVKMIELLVLNEGLDPGKVESFVKQAKERRHVKIYLSKRADFDPQEIPQYGDIPSDNSDDYAFPKENGRRVADNVKASIGTNDPQTVESVIISELLQVSNMKEYVKEYLPDIKDALDKIGRTLFLARLNISDLAKTHSAAEVNSFISNLRNVYRMLGENFIKLEQMVSDSETVPLD